MQNYAGSRLAPWLGHIMVSRSETARQLLTPGEIMQLPPDDEIVMVAGSPPIRAKKARYFQDARFKERIVAPPDPSIIVPTKRKDDWTDLGTRAPDEDLRAEIEGARADRNNAGLRREPELPDHVAIAKEKTPKRAAEEFKIILDDDAEQTARQRQALRRQMGGIARQAALNPDEGIDL
jgi:type IV secretion system protein VirD4